MSAEVSESRFDGLKWLVVVLLVALGVAGNIYYANESLLYRVLGLLGLLQWRVLLRCRPLRALLFG